MNVRARKAEQFIPGDFPFLSDPGCKKSIQIFKKNEWKIVLQLKIHIDMVQKRGNFDKFRHFESKSSNVRLNYTILIYKYNNAIWRKNFLINDIPKKNLL